MAANSKGRAIAGTLGKRFAKQIWAASSRDPSPLPALAISAARRSLHASTYDKNYDEQVRPAVVPDDVIEIKSDKYWGPHPHTGVFGPAEQHPNAACGASTSSAPADGGGASVLDQTAWFRPLEDVDKPPHA